MMQCGTCLCRYCGVAAVDGSHVGPVSCRLHGSEVLYASSYDDRSLNEWAERVAAAGQTVAGPPTPNASVAGCRKRRRDVFVYFDDDMKMRVPRSTLTRWRIV